MKKPTVLTPDDPVKEVGRVFNTPLVVRRDLSQLPLSQGAATVMFYLNYHRHDPSKRWVSKLKLSLGAMLVLLGSEWCHNLAHAYMAASIGKPVDAIRINLGMPLLVYFDPEDPEVTPREHILRAIGGPAFNLLMLLPLSILLPKMDPESAESKVARVAYDTNLFLATGSLAPIPFLDGGPLLKWSLVELGATPQGAERTVRKSNRLAAVFFSILGAFIYLFGKRPLGAMFSMIGLSSLAIALGLMEEAY